jgi:hypothetical protein
MKKIKRLDNWPAEELIRNLAMLSEEGSIFWPDERRIAALKWITGKMGIKTGTEEMIDSIFLRDLRAPAFPSTLRLVSLSNHRAFLNAFVVQINLAEIS